MHIERLGPDEGDRYRAIRLRSLADAPDAFGSTYDETAARPPEAWPSQLEALATFVAVIDGGDVGTVRGCRFEDAPNTAILLSMWVDPAARGHGVGEALIDALIEWARGEGYSRMVLDVADDNAAAVALYARKGFEPTGVTGTLPPPRDHVREHQRARSLRL